MKVTLSEANKRIKNKRVKLRQIVRVKGGLRFNCTTLIGKPFTLRVDEDDLVR